MTSVQTAADELWESAEQEGVAPAPCEPISTTVHVRINEIQRRLLIIEDEIPLCELVSLYFEHKGLAVAAACTAAEGTALIEQGQFDLLILDWKLDAGASGLDLLNLCKSMHGEVPVIIFTGTEDLDGVLQKQLSGRAEGVVRKMGSLEVLAAEVFKHLGPQSNMAISLELGNSSTTSAA
jgi:DNA-binding NtrC family response regulator